LYFLASQILAVLLPKPLAPETITISEGYRPFRIFEPYENQRLSNAYQNIDFFNKQADYDEP
jgi:hypothetical protein